MKYRGNAEVECPLEKPREATGFDDRHEGRRGMEGWYLVQGGIVFFHFVGTDHPMDVLTDIMAWKTKTGVRGIPDDVRVHYGFWRYAVRATAIVRDVLRRNPGVQYVELGGHSLGASVALLVAMAVKAKEPHRLIWVSMYGGPPVIGARAKKWVRENVVAATSADLHKAAIEGRTLSGVTRFRTPFDAVAGLIVLMRPLGYVHVAKSTVLRLGRKFKFRVSRLWKDHMKDSYCEGLRNTPGMIKER